MYLPSKMPRGFGGLSFPCIEKELNEMTPQSYDYHITTRVLWYPIYLILKTRTLKKSW